MEGVNCSEDGGTPVHVSAAMCPQWHRKNYIRLEYNQKQILPAIYTPGIWNRYHLIFYSFSNIFAFGSLTCCRVDISHTIYGAFVFAGSHWSFVKQINKDMERSIGTGGVNIVLCQSSLHRKIHFQIVLKRGINFGANGFWCCCFDDTFRLSTVDLPMRASVQNELQTRNKKQENWRE